MQDRAEGIGSQHRNLSDILAKIIFAFGALSTAYHLYVLMVQPIQPWILRSFHLTSSGILVFALIPWKADKKSEGPNLLDYSLAFLLVTTTIYLIVDFDNMLYRVGVDPNGYDVLFATITFLIILEMGRRLQGYVLPILALVCLAYALWGDYLPGLWGHRGYSFQRVVTYLFSLEGIFGPPLAASSTFIILFILFGAALQSSGAGRLFIDTSLAIAGGARGGPAKVAVFASSLFGTMSGSSVTNVVTTGTFTIPLMKSIGYRPAFAGAVETVASTGGQLMPPVMGVTAFVMAEVTGIPYLKIAAAGLIPAILFYVAVYFMIGVEAKNLGLSGLPKSELPRLWDVLRLNGHLLLPIFVLIYFLVYVRVSPMKSAFYAIGAAVVASWFRQETRMGAKRMAEALYRTMEGVIHVATPSALAGVVVGVLSLTGLGLKVTDLLLSYVGESKFLGLLAVMLVSIVLGMGVPTVAAYLVAAAAAGPALVKLGVPLLSAHMFIFYYAVLATMTPPVAASAFAAGALAEAHPMQVGFMAVRLGIAAYIVPFMFVYGDSLLMQGSWGGIGVAVATALFGVYALARCVIDRGLPLWRRGVLGAAALLLILTGGMTDLLGLIVLGLGVGDELLAWFRTIRNGRQKEDALEESP